MCSTAMSRQGRAASCRCAVGDVRLDRVQSVEGDEGSVQVQWPEQGLKVRGLVCLRVDLRLGEGHGPVVGDRGEQMPALDGQTG